MRFLTIIALLLSGCVKEGIDGVGTDNHNFEVVKIFNTADGCSVYRFEDGGYSRYFARCDCTTTTMSVTAMSTGKTMSVTHNDVPTTCVPCTPRP